MADLHQPRDTAPERSMWWWVRRASVVGVAASVSVHLVAGMIALLITVDRSDNDAGGEGSVAVDFALMSEAELAPLNDSTVQLSSTHAPDLAAPTLSEIELASEMSGGEIDALTSELVDVDIAAGGGDLSSGSLDAAGGGGLSGEGASFFGLEAKGSRFAYIVDVSGSMAGENRMARTKVELARSVAELSDHADVIIILFSSQSSPLMGEDEWLRMTTANKSRLRRRIEQIEPSGGTEPLEAFSIALNMKPAPDAIYFMTDGEFGENIPGDVRSMNRRSKVPIHSIMFGNIGNAQARSRVESMMKEISRDSGGGRFRHIGDGP
jgi:hypothetical protein